MSTEAPARDPALDPERRHDLPIAWLLLGFCAFMAWRTLKLSNVSTGTVAGPAFLPWLMIFGIAALALVMILRHRRAKAASQHGAAVTLQALRPAGALTRGTALRIGAFIAILVAYCALFMVLGYLATTIAVFIAGMALLGERRPMALLVLPCLITGTIWLAFTQALGVWLP